MGEKEEKEEGRAGRKKEEGIVTYDSIAVVVVCWRVGWAVGRMDE